MKDKVTYDFHGKKGWCSRINAVINSDKEAIEEAKYLREFFKDNTIKAYKVTKHYEEVKGQ